MITLTVLHDVPADGHALGADVANFADTRSTHLVGTVA